MKKLLNNLWENQRELVLYMLFGIVTNVVNWATYLICTRLFGISIYWSNILAWFFAVLAAYCTNRGWVFHSETTGTVPILKELTAFYGSRAFSGGIDLLLLFIMVHLFGFHDIISKIFTSCIVVLLNYILSRLVFRYFQNK